MDQALYYAQVAKLAYRDPTEFRETDIQLLEGGIPSFFDINECQAIVFHRRHNNALVVAFRGSDSSQDFYRVLRAHMRPLMIGPQVCGRVHAGFYDYYKTLRAGVNSSIIDYLGSGGTTVVFVGHSLGSCCVIAGLEWSLQSPRLTVECYTYGSPRIGDACFSDLLYRSVKMHRFAIRQDVVTRMPSMSCGCCCFVHTRGAHYLGPAASIQCFLLEVVLFFMTSQCIRSRLLKKHDIDRYVAILARA